MRESNPFLTLPVLTLTLALFGCAGDKATNSGAGRHSGAATGGTDRPAPAAGGPTAPAEARGPNTFTGTLKGGMAAIGGETTGWTLVADGQAGGLELDVSKVRRKAEGLEGKRVKVTGKMTQKSYVERGVTPVLVAESVEAAE